MRQRGAHAVYTLKFRVSAICIARRSVPRLRCVDKLIDINVEDRFTRAKLYSSRMRVIHIHMRTGSCSEECRHDLQHLAVNSGTITRAHVTNFVDRLSAF